MKTNVNHKNCPTRMVLDKIADKWTVLIVGCLTKGVYRFGELRHDIPGISPNVLTQKLRELERNGIVTRRIYACIPPKVEYSLTPLGQTLCNLLDAINIWAEKNGQVMLEARVRYDKQQLDMK